VRVLPPGELPETKYVLGSNFCDIGVVVDHRSRSVVLVCAIDNLVRGTAGMAVQCLNIKLGFDERMGLWQAPLTP